ncbi:MAG: DUF4097 domain-containing protein [bacterium]|nr:DUF4097 domain-containing protein [bacterium]
MKTLMNVIILLLISSLSIAQDIKCLNKTIPINEGDRIILELDGDITVKKAVGAEAELISTFIQKGKIIGYSNRNERKKYDIIVEKIGDHIWIKPKKIDKLGMLGISWYREEIKHLIYLPENIDVKISKKKGDITIVNAIFNNLDISNEYGDTDISIIMDRIRVINAVSNDGKITVSDDRIKDFAYSTFGTGNSVITIKSDKGDIFLDIIEINKEY